MRAGYLLILTASCLVQGPAENAPGRRGEWPTSRCTDRSGSQAFAHRRDDLFLRDAQRRERVSAGRRGRGGEADQQVLGADTTMAERGCLVDGRRDAIASIAGEALERNEATHPAPHPSERLRLARLAGRQLDDLVDALVAESEGFGDLAQGSARGVESADQVMKVDARDLGLVLELEEPFAYALSVLQDRLVEGHEQHDFSVPAG
jgi:hypothetical protein